MLGGETLEADRKLHVAGADNVLDLEVGKLGVEAELLDDSRVLARGKLGIGLGLGASHDHLTTGEDQSRGLGLANSHDDSGETLGVVLRISRVQGDRLQIQTARQVDRGYDVPLQLRSASRCPNNAKMVYTHCKVGVRPDPPCVAPGVAAGVAGVTPVPLAG